MKKILITLPATALVIGAVLIGCSQGNSSADSSTKNVKEVSTPSSDAPGGLVASTPEMIEKFHMAALDGNSGGVKEALEAGTNVNVADADERTALMLAAYNGHSEIVLLLLDEGAAINRRDGMDRTALLYAATGPFPETVKILLDKGAEPNVVDSNEHFSPLMHAAAEGNLDVAKILLEAGADPTLKDVDGDNAASFARQAGHLEVAKYLDSL